MKCFYVFALRYSLAILDVGYLKSSYIRGNSFRDGFNTAIGVYGSNGLIIEDNVIYKTVGSSVIITGTRHKLLHNLVILSLSPGITRKYYFMKITKLF